MIGSDCSGRDHSKQVTLVVKETCPQCAPPCCSVTGMSQQNQTIPCSTLRAQSDINNGMIRTTGKRIYKGLISQQSDDKGAFFFVAHVPSNPKEKRKAPMPVNDLQDFAQRAPKHALPPTYCAPKRHPLSRPPFKLRRGRGYGPSPWIARRAATTCASWAEAIQALWLTPMPRVITTAQAQPCAGGGLPAATAANRSASRAAWTWR